MSWLLCEIKIVHFIADSVSHIFFGTENARILKFWFLICCAKLMTKSFANPLSPPPPPPLRKRKKLKGLDSKLFSIKTGCFDSSWMRLLMSYLVHSKVEACCSAWEFLAVKGWQPPSEAEDHQIQSDRAGHSR